MLAVEAIYNKTYSDRFEEEDDQQGHGHEHSGEFYKGMMVGMLIFENFQAECLLVYLF